MVNIKATVRIKTKSGIYPVYIRFTKKKQTSYIKTAWVVNEKGLSSNKEITDPYVIQQTSSLIETYCRQLNLVDSTNWSTSEVVRYLSEFNNDISFSDYARKHIDKLIGRGQERTSRNYKWAIQHMERFAETDNIMFSRLTSAFLNRWIESLAETNRCKEQYPVCMREVYKAAMKEFNDEELGITKLKNPWTNVKIPRSDIPEKRAIPASKLRAFFNVVPDRSRFTNPLMEVGQDVALISFGMCGLNAVDIFNAKKDQYLNGIFHYERQKTKKTRSDNGYFEVRVPEFIKPTFEKYLSKDPKSPWLFNFHDRHTTSDSFSANVNIGIRKICESMGIAKENWHCVYTFRHTWGTVAQNDCGASISEVAFGMNHSAGHRITRGYIKLDFTPAWELNERVVDFIFFSDQASKQAAQEEESSVFRLSPKMLIKAAAFFQGKCLASFDDIGCSNIDEVIARLVKGLPSDIPPRSIVQFKIVNCDNGKVAVYERQKGKGF